MTIKSFPFNYQCLVNMISKWVFSLSNNAKKVSTCLSVIKRAYQEIIKLLLSAVLHHMPSQLTVYYLMRRSKKSPLRSKPYPTSVRSSGGSSNMSCHDFLSVSCNNNQILESTATIKKVSNYVNLFIKITYPLVA